MSTLTLLLDEIERFCRDAEISETTFSRRFANDGKFVGRLRAGRELTVGMYDRAKAYIAEQRQALRLPDGDAPSAKAGKRSKAA